MHVMEAQGRTKQRGSEQSQTSGIRFPADIRAEVMELADLETRNFSAQVIHLVKKALAAEKAAK